MNAQVESEALAKARAACDQFEAAQVGLEIRVDDAMVHVAVKSSDGELVATWDVPVPVTAWDRNAIPPEASERMLLASHQLFLVEDVLPYLRAQFEPGSLATREEQWEAAKIVADIALSPNTFPMPDPGSAFDVHLRERYASAKADFAAGKLAAANARADEVAREDQHLREDRAARQRAFAAKEAQKGEVRARELAASKVRLQAAHDDLFGVLSPSLKKPSPNGLSAKEFSDVFDDVFGHLPPPPERPAQAA